MSLKVTVIRPGELNAQQLKHWETLQQADPALHSPYFSPQFAEVVAEVRDDVFISIIEDAGTIVGFFPFQKGKMKTGRPVGGALSDFHGVIADTRAEIDGGELIRKSGLSTWDFDHLLAAQKSFKPFHKKTAQSPYIDLPDGYEAYAAARRESGSEQIKKTGNLIRKLEREVGEIRFELHSADSTPLAQLLKWKSAQYAESRLVDIFKIAWTGELLRRLLQTRAGNFAGVLSTIYVNDRLVAAHMGMRSGDVLHYWFPAYDAEFARFSPGLILLLKVAQAAPAAGIRRIDLGKGDALYKERLANGATELAEGCVELPSLTSAMRRLRRGAESWARASSLGAVAKVPGRLIRKMEHKLRFH